MTAYVPGGSVRRDGMIAGGWCLDRKVASERGGHVIADNICACCHHYSDRCRDRIGCGQETKGPSQRLAISGRRSTQRRALQPIQPLAHRRWRRRPRAGERDVFCAMKRTGARGAGNGRVMDQPEEFESQALPPGHEALIVARTAGAGERGIVWVERRGAPWSDGLSLRAAARDSLFLGRSRCGRDSGQSHDDSKRKCYPH